MNKSQWTCSLSIFSIKFLLSYNVTMWNIKSLIYLKNLRSLVAMLPIHFLNVFEISQLYHSTFSSSLQWFKCHSLSWWVMFLCGKLFCRLTGSVWAQRSREETISITVTDFSKEKCILKKKNLLKFKITWYLQPYSDFVWQNWK